MPGIDERLKHELERLAAPADLSGAFERIASKRRRHRALRKVWTSLLGVAVIAGTVVGAYSLNRVFRAGAGGGGQVAFVRLLRPCYEHPNVDGGLEVFAVDVATGEQRLLGFDPTFPDGTLQSERWPDLSPDGTRYVWVDHYRDDLYVTDVLSRETRRLTNGLTVGPPHFSPDGSKILFSAAGETVVDESTPVAEETSDIYVINADGTGRTRLTEGSIPSWTPDGRIAFMRTHARVVINEQGDVTRVETTPQPTEFFLMNADGSGIEKVYEAPGDVQIVDGDWSPDGEKLVGEAVVRGNHDIYVVDIEGRTATRLTDDPAQDTSPTWSPDGSMIAFQTGRWDDFTGHAEIAVINADGTGLRRLTNDCWQDQDPAWIPDDAAVAELPVWTPPPLPDLGEPGTAEPEDILVTDLVEGIGDLYALDPDTGERTNLTADLTDQLSPAWSPDRTRIAFAGDLDERGNLDIYVMSIDGSDLTRLTSGPEGEDRPTWSPDGTAIAFEGDGVWVVKADGSGHHQVTQGGQYPAWSPDGARIAFARDGDICVVRPDGSELRRLTTNGDNYEVSWSPDGTRLAFTHVRDVHVMNADGSGIVNLTGGPRDTYERGPEWSPDGAQILFASDRDGGNAMRLYVMNADGSHVRPIGGAFGFCCPDPDW